MPSPSTPQVYRLSWARLRPSRLFFFSATATTETYTLSLHDALPISRPCASSIFSTCGTPRAAFRKRSEEHTSELQSRENLVCRLLLEKKKTQTSSDSRR